MNIRSFIFLPILKIGKDQSNTFEIISPREEPLKKKDKKQQQNI